MRKKLLAVFICFLAFSGYASGSDIRQDFDDWNLIISTDKLTDEIKYFASTEELNNQHSSFVKKYYAFTCAKGKLVEFTVVQHLPLLDNIKVKLDFRIDKEKPFQRNSVISRGSFINEHITAEEIEQLKGKNSLFIRANTPSRNINMEFSLKGFDQAIQPLLEACNENKLTDK